MDYYNSSSTYGGGKTVENATLAFLKNWITTLSFDIQYSKISSELMAKVIGSSDTFCLGEGELYRTLVEWLYMNVTGSTFEENEEDQDRTDKASDYFRQLAGPTPFLATEEGKPYVEAFRKIRINDLLLAKRYTVSELRKDKILPENWLREATVQNWDRIVSGVDADKVSDINEQNFDEICTREGITIEKFANISEELECVLIGLELSCEKSGTNRVFKIKRVQGDLEANAEGERDIWIRIKIVVDDEKGRIQFSASSGIKKVSLKIDETSQLLQIGEEFDAEEFSIGINYYVV